MFNFNMDNVNKILENENKDYVYLKEDNNMNNINAILKDAVAVWANLKNINGKKTRFERLVDGRWYDWASRNVYGDDYFRKTLENMIFGKEYVVEYA